MILDKLKVNGFLPSLIVTAEDKPKGRKMLITPPPVKIWVEENNISYIQPATLKTSPMSDIGEENWDVFVVASYGKILPKEILDLPLHGTLNTHPSLLPKLRGASPIKSSILGESETGVTIIHLDNEIDHGPIVAQKKVEIPEWPPYEKDLEKILAEESGKLLAEILPEWISGKIKEVEQNHNTATYCKKIEKTDGELDLSKSPEENLRKIRAFHRWPGAYFFFTKNGKKTRIKITLAHIENGDLILDRVIPEGKKEMSYSDFLRG